MKIDRRSFLSLGIGVTAGTTLSPLPWKLTDDLSIWTQMWPWTPVPKDGEVSYVHSVCTLCPGGCGISVRKVADRAVKIEGMDGYPGNDGSACPLGLSGLQLLYGPTAIQSPLKRVGERGAGKWQKISWEAAIAEVAEKIGRLREDGKAHTLGCITDSDCGTVPELFKRFLTAFGSPNFMRTPSCADTYEMTLKLMHGTDASPGFDVENANFVLSFGSGIIEGWGTPGRMFRAHSAWKDKKVKVVQAEPRLSNTAAKAGQWLPISPGTEGILALGLAHVIIKENLYDKNFVDNYSFGFEDWKDSTGKVCKGFKSVVTDRYTPGYVSGITGIDSGDIEALAREFAGASSPLAICGRGQGSVPGSIHEFMAVHALNALMGNLNRAGGVSAVQRADYITWPEPEPDRVAQNSLKNERADGAGSARYPYTKSLLTRLPAAINSAEESPIQALFVANANPCYTLPDTEQVREAFAKIPLIVSFAAHMNETAEMADIILPDLGHLERYEDVPTPFGMNTPMVGLARPVVSPRKGARHVGDALLLLAKQMGGSIAKAFPWTGYEDCLKKTMGKSWTGLTENGFVAKADYKPAGWDAAFATPSKKFQFMSEACGHEGKTGLGAVAAEGDPKAYPLVLIPYDSMRLSGGAVANTPFLTKTVADTVLTGKEAWAEVNPKTGGKLGLAEGVHATLTTPKGSVRVRVHFSNGMMPGMIAMPRGLGHTAPDAYLAGKGINLNALVGPVADPASGLDAAWGIRANLVIA